MQYAVYQSMTQDYLGTIDIEGGVPTVKSTADYGDFEFIIEDLQHYGVEAGIEHLSRYLDFVEVESVNIVKTNTPNDGSGEAHE